MWRSETGHSRRFDLGLATSGLPLSTDIDAPTSLVRFVPGTDLMHCSK